MSKVEIKGVMPPITTPFDADGNILYDQLRANLKRLLETGLHGFVVLGSNGEYVMLSEAEKFAVWETARSLIPRDRLFLAGAGADSTRATIALTKRAAELGADAALLVTPHYYRPQMTGAAWIQHFRAVADASPIPILIYNVPPYTNVDIDAATVIELAQHENIIGMKDSSGNFAKMGEIIRFAPPHFAMMTGTGATIHIAMSLGARGGIPALANIAGRECVQLYNLIREGKLENARNLQLRVIRPNTAVTSRWGVPGLKAAMDELGYFGGPPRSPLMSLNDADREKLRAILKEAELS